MTSIGSKIHITGIVQGVGFRPFVYGLAARLHLMGWVRNTSAGVDIEIEGEHYKVNKFINALKQEAPPLARIVTIEYDEYPPIGYNSFEIYHSEAILDAFQPISPDVCICPDCLHELFSPDDRRYRYPFINCTNCGPRFTIITDIPYDRPNTTMASFPMCPACSAEYNDPLNRRFHAQPIACPTCGPQVWMEINKDMHGGDQPSIMGDHAILMFQQLMSEGLIIAIKGLGGFHIACDATNPNAVAELRKRKLRVDKPFAIMMPDLAMVEQHCVLDETSKQLLESRERPIVILPRKHTSTIVEEVSPRQNTLGVMLPYTPLHYLLFAKTPGGFLGENSVIIPPTCLVMTSGNLSEEPIAIDNNEAQTRLGKLVDGFLMHNRPIRTRCDDSVMRVFSGVYPLRRSRGYTPSPIFLPNSAQPLLATGAELKNTFCLTRDRYTFLSHHIGDLENYETLQSFEDGIIHFERLFHIEPEAIVHDLHPNYLSTRYAMDRAEREHLPYLGVQHHHAHIASCMAENGLRGESPVIGVAFDGTGYGDDGHIWGSEFILADYSSYTRLYHLAYNPLPGGDSSIRKPGRIALAYLWQAGMDWIQELPPVRFLSQEEKTVLRSQLEHKLNSPLTSSMGRLFDAVSALIGVRTTVNYEAQAAIELEELVSPDEHGVYPFDISKTFPGTIITEPLMKSIVNDILTGQAKSTIAARFHNSIASMVHQVLIILRIQTQVNDVVLSGGVWQNITLLRKAVTMLKEDGFNVYIHHQVPPNDGGLSLGQAVIASSRFR